MTRKMDSQFSNTNLKGFVIVVLFAVGLAYIESAVVVYLREIFYPAGFTFPLADLRNDPRWLELLITEVGREVATIIVLLSGCWLIGSNFRTRLAYFLTIFAVWDIFYYIWLKVLINWPASIMDWDILFLIPGMWASPVCAPVAISLTMLAFAIVILHRESSGKPLHAGGFEIAGLIAVSVFIIVMFYRAGLHVTEDNFQAYFNWPLFLTSEMLAVLLFTRCCLK